MKKMLLGLTTIVSVTTPALAVVACGASTSKGHIDPNKTNVTGSVVEGLYKDRTKIDMSKYPDWVKKSFEGSDADSNLLQKYIDSKGGKDFFRKYTEIGKSEKHVSSNKCNFFHSIDFAFYKNGDHSYFIDYMYFNIWDAYDWMHEYSAKDIDIFNGNSMRWDNNEYHVDRDTGLYTINSSHPEFIGTTSDRQDYPYKK